MRYAANLKAIAGLGGYLLLGGVKLTLGGALTVLLSPVVAAFLDDEELDTLMKADQGENQ